MFGWKSHKHRENRGREHVLEAQWGGAGQEGGGSDNGMYQRRGNTGRGGKQRGGSTGGMCSYESKVKLKDNNKEKKKQGKTIP